MMLKDDLKNKILLFDGAMGTELQKFDPQESDFPGNKYGFNDGLNVTHQAAAPPTSTFVP